jgi:hypothetical protein
MSLCIGPPSQRLDIQPNLTGAILSGQGKTHTADSRWRLEGVLPGVHDVGMALVEVIGGAALGFGLSELSAWRARRDEREHTRRERVRERQLEAVQGLDRALEAAHASFPMSVAPDQVGEKQVKLAHDHWHDGFFKEVPYVRDRELLDRYDAVGWVLLSCWLEAGRGHDVDTWFIIRAIDNARQACTALIMDEPLPPRTFPTRDEVAKMVRIRRDGYDWSALSDWLLEHPEE